MIRFTLFFIFSYCTTTCFSKATDSTWVTFVFEHGDYFEIRVDKENVYTTDQFFLSEGTHIIEIWNPKLELIYDTIFVEKSSLNRFRYAVSVSKEFLDFKKEEEQFNVVKSKRVILPLILTSGIATTCFITYLQGRSSYLKLKDLKRTYANTTDSSFFMSFSSNFKTEKLVYDKLRKRYYLLAGATLVSSLCSALLIKRFRMNFSKPKKNFNISPYTNRDYSLSLNLTVSSVQLSLNF